MCAACATWHTHGVCAAGLGGAKCDKCKVPENAGGCKCDANCDCLGAAKCDKCKVPENAGGCKCDAKCVCLGAAASAGEQPV